MPLVDTPARAPAARRPAGTLLSTLALAGALAAAASPLLARWTAPWPTLGWLLDLGSHWMWLFLALAVIGSLPALRRAGHRWRAWPVLAVSVLLLTCRLDGAPRAESAPAGRTLTAATANLNLDTTDFTPLIRWLQSHAAPDVISLQEFTPQAAAALAAVPAVRQRYAHQVLLPQDDQFGLAVLSRWPLAAQEILRDPAGRTTPKIRVLIQLPARQVALTAAHPMPPLNPDYTRARDASLLDEARRLADLAAQGQPGVLLGDFNATPWSAGLRSLAPHVHRASGLTSTWPALGGLGSVLPLDHLLVTAGWAVAAQSLGPHLGSDHRPVVATLVLR